MTRRCRECGRACHEDASPGVWLHSSGAESSGVDHEADADHVALPDWELCPGPHCGAANAIREAVADGRCLLCLEVEQPEVARRLVAEVMAKVGVVDLTPGRG